MNQTDSGAERPSTEARSPLFFWAGFVLIIVLGGMVFRPTLDADFVNYDDPNVVVENEAVHDVDGQKFLSVFSEVRDQAYLPIYYASYWIDDLLFGAEPGGYHLINLVWHLLNALLVFQLWRRIVSAGRGDLALAAAALYTVHPVVVESVAWISSRKDLVSMAFLLLALLVFERALRKEKGIFAHLSAVLLFSVGMFAKASILVGPILAWIIYRRHRARGVDASAVSSRLGRPALLAWCLAALATTVFHFMVARSQGTASIGGDEGISRAFGMVGVLGRYVRNLCLPFDLSVHYDVDLAGGFSIDHLNGLIALGFVGAALFFFLRRAGPIAFGTCWLGASLLPFNNLFPRFSIAMADRYLYVGAAGFSLALMALLFHLLRGREWAARAAACLLVLGAGYLAHSRTAIWQDSESLWRDALSKTESSSIPPIQLGAALEVKAAEGGFPAREALVEAGELYELAVRRATSPLEAMQSRLKLAPLLVRLGRSQDAVKVFDRIQQDHREDPGLKLDSEDLDRVLVSRASAMLSLGKLDDARQALDEVSEDSVARLDALNLRAFADIVEANAALQVPELDEEGQKKAQAIFERGLSTYEEILERDASHEKTRVEYVQSLSVATWRSGAILEASRLVRELVDDFPRNAQARYLKARLYVEVDPQAAERDLKIAVRLDPARVEPYLLYEQLLRTQGRNKEAIAVLELGLRERPDSEQLEYAMSQSFLAFAYHHKNTGSLEFAFDAVGRSLNFSELNLEAYLLRAELLVQRTGVESRTPNEKAADWEAAKADFEYVLKQAPEETRARIGLAGFHRARGMAMLYRAPKGEDGRALEAAAFDDLKRACDLAGDDPAFATTHRIVANYEANKAKRAERDAAKAREKKLERAMPIADRARAALKERKYDEALKLSDEALEVSGFAPDLYELSGIVRMERGEVRLAIANFELALEGNPKQIRALFELGRLHAEQQEWRKTRDAFRRFVVVAAEDDLMESLPKQLKIAKSWIQYAETKIVDDKKSDGEKSAAPKQEKSG